MALAKDEQRLIDVANEIEALKKHSGWKHVERVWQAMYLDVVGGITKDGDFVLGTTENSKVMEKPDFYIGYKTALFDFWYRTMKEPMLAKEALYAKVKEEEVLSRQGKINRFETHPNDIGMIQ